MFNRSQLQYKKSACENKKQKRCKVDNGLDVQQYKLSYLHVIYIQALKIGWYSTSQHVKAQVSANKTQPLHNDLKLPSIKGKNIK